MENPIKTINESVFSFNNKLFQLKKNVEFYTRFLSWRNLLVLENKDSGTMLHLLNFDDLAPSLYSEWFSPVLEINQTNEARHDQ